MLKSMAIVKIVTSKICGEINTVTKMDGDYTFCIHIHHKIKGQKNL